MRTLVAYFTWSGNTKEIAERIARKTHGKLFRIEREIPYSTDYNTCAYTEAKEEADKHLRPAILGLLPDLGEYDAVIVAFPIWWYTMPAPVMTFLESYTDWQGKILPRPASACWPLHRPSGSQAIRLVNKMYCCGPSGLWLTGSGEGKSLWNRLLLLKS